MKNTLIVVALLVGMLVSVVFAQQPQKATAWEYKLEYKMNEKKANDLGSQGWELVAIGTPSTGSLMNVQEYVFKRAK